MYKVNKTTHTHFLIYSSKINVYIYHTYWNKNVREKKYKNMSGYKHLLCLVGIIKINKDDQYWFFFNLKILTIKEDIVFEIIYDHRKDEYSIHIVNTHIKNADGYNVINNIFSWTNIKLTKYSHI